MNTRVKHLIQRTTGLLPRSARHLLFRAGVVAGGTASFPSVSSTLSYLKRRGFRPRTIVDVGAYVGNWTRMVKTLFPSARVLMVEPQADKQGALARVRAEFAPSALLQDALLGAEDDQPVEFVVMETGSSVLEEQSDHYPRTTVARRTTTLDRLVDDAGWQHVDFLKLDVQGYELEVLRGASACLPTCEFVLMEVSVVPMNLGAPTVDEVFAFMTERGFRMLDLCDQHRRHDVLVQVDLLFINVRSSHAPLFFQDHAEWCARHEHALGDVLSPATWAG
ncbi:MAG: FkbM family methyltransferase [Bacteroidota bacterium]